MTIAFSISGTRRGALRQAFFLMLCAATTLMTASLANAKEPFTAFNYVAGPVLSSPGHDSKACTDTGAPVCPAQHTCKYYGYIGTGVGTPGFGKTNIEVCIKADEFLGVQNATLANCLQAEGLALITYQITRRSQKVIIPGLLGQTCEANTGASVATLTQNMTLTAGPWTGNLSISSPDTDGSTGFLSIYGAIQPLVSLPTMVGGTDGQSD
jgi:hypothetical protein